ncbi:dihydrodipicolinate synthase family protein [Niabella drilacis]|uniref:4-hydroxy-tetrahydrodipicolinate synthase n=1 Tax=Niabella drilacis (strain DSM 25811 / CCM 8410 / CCUG 62505 / LMG 26954 / E90) TaxID=1285928 RepID=A0A1G6Y2C8_NIADE|nr:dihydrodipicolinate synthase family protein [Niabella drilacis]SDD84093.1 4-hydroxy-tetrahydrodipicolinate synthase [Niabella drilacis]
MKPETLPRGLWPVMLTPFLENNQPDLEGLKTLTEFYIQNGAKGLFANCLSGEMFQLTDAERIKLVRTVVEAAGARVPVVASGTFTSNLHTCADFIARVYDTGVEAVVVINNQLAAAEEPDDVFKQKTEQLLQRTRNIPLGLYECPYPYKRQLSPGLIQWLATTGRFLYHKDTSCNPGRIRAKLQAISGSRLSFYNANTATALLSLEAGAAGIAPIGANLYPELYRYLVDRFETGGSTAALRQLNEQLDMMDTVVDLSYPFSAKYFLKKRGLPISTHCRIPYENMNAERYLKLDALMQVFERTAGYFGIRYTSTL